ncbi:MAG: histidinol dehydrogenase, partial [Desulfonatronovibrionaceae bacterium]
MDIADFEFRTPADFIFLRDRLQSRGLEAGGIRDKVLPILEDVRTHGDQALVKYTRRFDCPDFSASDLELGPRDMEEAMHRVDTEQLRNIQEAVERIRSYHLRQRENSWFDPGADGAMVGQMNLPVQSAGLYVPGGQGGKTPLVSSLIMTAVPALVAGVENICPVSPPGKNGSLNDYILATAGVLGLNRIFCCGSAWAIAALAWGTETIPRVDVIAGPGNIFVSSAKEMVSGIVGID